MDDNGRRSFPQAIGGLAVVSVRSSAWCQTKVPERFIRRGLLLFELASSSTTPQGRDGEIGPADDSAVLFFWLNWLLGLDDRRHTAVNIDRRTGDV
jgi:hypothetical protein